jgi:hypothetical protein
MLPHESHGYRSREAVLHTLAQMFEWLDTHVKQAARAVGKRARSGHFAC